MPRGAKKIAHQHNSRHENGVVAPGKRITKQKSNGHINPGADGHLQAGVVSSASVSSSVTRPALPVHDRETNGNAAHIRSSSQAAYNVDGKDSGDVSEEAETRANSITDGSSEHNHRRIDVNAARSPVGHDSSTLSLALTILWSCPIGDTIAILIFLLSLPPTFLTLTNTLFAILTFMPPASSISTFPTTLNDVFQGSGGAPSFATIILTDLIGLVLWLVVWTPAQVVALELAQAVVATTLGGGNSVKSKGSDHTIMCMGIVVVSHVARHKWIPNRFFGYDWSVRLASLSNISLGPASFMRNDNTSNRTYAGWFSILIALHILVQGLVHVVRRWYAKREHQRPKPSSKKSDPEAVIESPSRLESAPLGAPCLVSAVSQELTPRSSLPNIRDSRDKNASNKKKKKQGNYVRSQQPLWAAFAATKVTVCREFDQSKVLQETSGSNAKDTKNLGSAPFLDEEGQVWITHVRSNSFSFDTSHLASKALDCDSLEHTDTVVRAGIDRSIPFSLRINGADWTSVVIRRSPRDNGKDESAEQFWTGEVFGLSPSSSYICSFVRSEDNVEMFTANVSTQSSPSVNQETSLLVTPPLQPHRPASPTTPITTLKNSIAACEAALSEAQARQKRGKKDSKAASLSLRKEIDGLNSKIAKIGADDKAQTSRQLQWNQHMRQADEAIILISNELDSMNSIPEDDVKDWQQAKHDWEVEKGHQDKTREELFRCKEVAWQERSAVQAEGTSTQQKRERLTTRGTKLNEQRQRLLSATAEGLNEKERREAEIAAKAADRRQFEERSREQVTNMQRSIQEAQLNAQQAWQQVQALQSAHQQQQLMNAAIDEPITPEGDIPGTGMPSTAPSGFRFPGFVSNDYATMRGGSSTAFRHDIRPHSNSLLSGGNSTYADFDDQDPAPPMPSLRPIGKLRGRQESGSSGSGSGSGSGSSSSQRDPTSPAVGGMRMSPSEKRGSPVWN